MIQSSNFIAPISKFVVENDSFLRLIQVVLDPNASEERFAAFAHFCKHDTPDFLGWCDKIRAQAQNIYPSEVVLVDNQGELQANLAGATVAVVEELTIGATEIAERRKLAQIRAKIRLHHAQYRRSRMRERQRESA